MKTSTAPAVTARMIRESVNGIDAATEGMRYRPDYPGRGMNGATCPAVEGSRLGDLVLLGASIAYTVGSESQHHDPGDVLSDVDAATGTAIRPRVEALGTGYVAWWPNIAPEAAEDQP